jgi:hypothetical protein
MIAGTECLEAHVEAIISQDAGAESIRMLDKKQE